MTRSNLDEPINKRRKDNNLDCLTNKLQHIENVESLVKQNQSYLINNPLLLSICSTYFLKNLALPNFLQGLIILLIS